MAQQDNDQLDSHDAARFSTSATIIAAAHQHVEQNPAVPAGRRFDFLSDADGNMAVMRDNSPNNPRPFTLLPPSVSSVRQVSRAGVPSHLLQQPFRPQPPLSLFIDGHYAGRVDSRGDLAYDALRRLLPNAAAPADLQATVNTTGGGVPRLNIHGFPPSISVADRNVPHRPATHGGAVNPLTTAAVQSRATVLPDRSSVQVASSALTAKRTKPTIDWSKASEQPQNNQKGEDEACLTCVEQGRKCGGTELFWANKAWKCKNCAFPRSNGRSTTGTRRCLWRDEAAGVTTLQQARDHLGIKRQIATTSEYKAAKAEAARRGVTVDEYLEELAEARGMTKDQLTATFGRHGEDNGGAAPTGQAKGNTTDERGQKSDEEDESDEEDIRENLPAEDLEAAVDAAWKSLIQDARETADADSSASDAQEEVLAELVTTLINDFADDEDSPWPVAVIERLRARLAETVDDDDEQGGETGNVHEDVGNDADDDEMDQ